ncbi:MAG: hypothetical protein IPN09_16370 [Bacteroidetes bacterium]|nr:hypothetical protein [Bacteroidota bacterium]
MKIYHVIKHQKGHYSFLTFRKLKEVFYHYFFPIHRPRMRRNTLREALDAVSENLTTGFNHKFIARYQQKILILFIE